MSEGPYFIGFPRMSVSGFNLSLLTVSFQITVLLYRVPQGSVLGPVFFTLYSQALSDVISQHNCSFHKYANNTELSKNSLLRTLSVLSCLFKNVSVLFRVGWIVISSCLMLIKRRF